MIHLGDGQDIFLFNALCLSPANLLRVCPRLPPSLALGRRLPFHLPDGIHSSRSPVEEKVAALPNEGTRPVAGANYCTAVAQHSGEGEVRGAERVAIIDSAL